MTWTPEFYSGAIFGIFAGILGNVTVTSLYRVLDKFVHDGTGISDVIVFIGSLILTFFIMSEFSKKAK